MVRELLEQQVFMYVMLALGGLGIIAKLLLLPVYTSLVRASFHMPDTGNRLFKLMRLKFQACYELKISVHNVERFVDKYFLNHKFCGICLHTWRKFSSQMAFLCMCIGAASGVLGVMEECSTRLILEHAGIGLLSGALLYVLDGLCAFDFKQEQMKVNAIDFFDNFLKSRLETQYFYEEKSSQQPMVEQEAREQAAASAEPEEEQDKPQPVPAKRRRKPEMYLTAEGETAAGKEMASAIKAGSSRAGRRTEEELLEHNMEEEEKEKIIEDILKEYLV